MTLNFLRRHIAVLAGSIHSLNKTKGLSMNDKSASEHIKSIMENSDVYEQMSRKEGEVFCNVNT